MYVLFVVALFTIFFKFILVILPYVLGLVIVSVFNAITDPTTAGLGDSERAMTYSYPQITDDFEE